MKLFNRDDSSRATEGFEEAYAFPEKIFRIFGISRSILLHFKFKFPNFFAGISNAKREFNIRNLFASLYKWFHLLDPLLFLVFAFNSIENFGDMNRTFEAMCGSSAAINVRHQIILFFSPYHFNPEFIDWIGRSEVVDVLRSWIGNRQIETDGSRRFAEIHEQRFVAREQKCSEIFEDH